MITLDEAIKWLKEHFNPEYECCVQDEVINMAIEALEKQVPKKFKMVDGNIPVCPVCGEEVWDMDWCNFCGQRIADEEEDDYDDAG